MKNCLLLSLVFLFLAVLTISAQTTECGTPDISETDYMALPWYGDEDDSFLNNFYDSLNK